MVSPSIPNGIYQFIKISPNKLPMLSNKVHCDPKKQRNPKMQSNTKSSAIQKAEQYKKQRDPKSSAIKWIINSVQRKKAARHQIALSTKKARVHPITSNRPPPSSYYQPITFNCKSTPISTIFVTREIHFVPILSSSSSLIPFEINHIITFPPVHILLLIQSID